MRPGCSSKRRAHGGFRVMGVIAAVGVAGLQLMTMLAKGSGDEAWIDAVYRFRTDAIPSCEQLAGRARMRPAEGSIEWARLDGLGASTTIDGRCRIDARLAI